MIKKNVIKREVRDSVNTMHLIMGLLYTISFTVSCTHLHITLMSIIQLAGHSIADYVYNAVYNMG